MGWYKTALDMDNFEDRNLVNDKIKFFKSVYSKLIGLSKSVFQDARSARVISLDIANHKKLSSHPYVRDMLLSADQIVLDSPWRFSDVCIVASEEVNKQIRTLEKERKEFTEITFPQRVKGWVDSHGE